MKKIKILSLEFVLILIAIIMVFPMFWMLLLSLKEAPEQFNSILEVIKSKWTTSNYFEALSSDNFSRYFFNSFFVSTIVTACNVLFCLLTGYTLARKEFIGKNIINISILGLLIIPSHVVMIPLYRLMVNFNWINSYYSLIIPWTITPFGIYLVKQYIESIPRQIEDAAKIDGASEWYILFRIIAPLCKPILVVLIIYTFLNNWNSFLFPFLFTNDISHRTLPVGLTFYLGKQSVDWGHLMAGASISALPILLLFTIFQKRIIEGLTAGALKQ